MELTDTVATLGVGSGDERILFRLRRRTLTAEVTPTYWARIGRKSTELDDGTLFGGFGCRSRQPHAACSQAMYVGPHDIAVVDISFDGRCLRVQRHGLGDMFGQPRTPADRNWYAVLDTAVFLVGRLRSGRGHGVRGAVPAPQRGTSALLGLHWRVLVRVLPVPGRSRSGCRRRLEHAGGKKGSGAKG